MSEGPIETADQASGEPSRPAPDAQGRARRLWALKLALLSAIVFILSIFLVPCGARVAAGLRYPYQLDSEEGFVLWQAWQLRAGRNIFRRLDSPPYVAATYGPLYPLINAAFLSVKEPSFFGGRLIAALSLAAICALLALIIWQETRQPLAALLGPLLFLNSYDVFQWLPFYRVDFPALALGLAGLWLVGRSGGPSQWRRRAATACFVAMVYTRQVELAPFLAALIYLLARDRRAAWRLARDVAVWGLGIAAALALLTRGQFLVHNVYYNANPFSGWQLKRMLSHYWLFHRFFSVALLVCVIWFVLERFALGESWSRQAGAAERPKGEKGKGDWGRMDLFAIYALVASIGLLGLGKIGAATNYLIEPQAAWSLLIALVLGKTLSPSRETGEVFGRRPVFFPVAVVLVLHATEFFCCSTLRPILIPWLQDHPSGLLARIIRQPAVRDYLNSRPQVLLARDNRNPTAADVLNGQRIIEMLRESPEPVFCEHPIFDMLSGGNVYIQPFILSQLANEGKWDQTPVVEALRQRQFSLIVATEDILTEGFLFHYTKEMTAAIRQCYRLREVMGAAHGTPSVFTYYIFEPKE